MLALCRALWLCHSSHGVGSFPFSSFKPKMSGVLRSVLSRSVCSTSAARVAVRVVAPRFGLRLCAPVPTRALATDKKGGSNSNRAAALIAANPPKPKPPVVITQSIYRSVVLDAPIAKSWNGIRAFAGTWVSRQFTASCRAIVCRKGAFVLMLVIRFPIA